ncbi:Uncharacterised protein [Kingella potus]|uniref:Uncharacterized protein n=1 Tax=Kingella potus TaxID=265175 RepID=A0A377R2X1_9NEIS|nr:protein YgfX [Kingella potus]UOO99962.1 transcriptional regulator [Kingella potus]STR03240.1 Uncharacterised protein [Kingella potus]
MQPFCVRIRPSLSLAALSLLLHAAAFTICAVWFYGAQRAFGLAALALSLAHSLRAVSGRRNAVEEIHIGTKGHSSLKLKNNAELVPAQLLDDSLVHPYACFLKWRIGERTFRQCIPADAADAESYRRLTVWVRYGQPRKEKQTQ